ncbi:2-oxoacid:ferredoxin oxidoreductase subunit beta [Alteromonas macleodii]|uniref:2-oxoglutarate oxidoreductase subunit KorB n=1 Tax=Alteromonas macleodii TaxID=28108 RepID=A0A6T9Y5T3_ALTMA|nr:2-oxoacid:ferredoxin oxidoreductase subunit beta [Alteromonas macleodii]CAB9495194.1 2-oxoglutarate oxidoreductase subunit KorB [Alteromonas macleodii]
MTIVKDAKDVQTLKKSDFVSDQDVRWCPGCGDYSILSSVQKVLPQLNVPKEKIVFVSGIGCSSRMPYYLDTYGFHTIHGRAPTIATGIKIANPDLSVWVITGDGDSMSIGANHLLHILRRNINVNILLINNRIYGLTKGQFSPTSEKGKVTKSSPNGSIESPVDPISFALSAGATFVARAIDTDAPNLQNVLLEGAKHKGASFIEVLQNCNIFNDGAFSSLKDRKTNQDSIVHLLDKSPLLFGANKDKVIVSDGFNPSVQTIGANEPLPPSAIYHTERAESSLYPHFLSNLKMPDFPIPLGIFKREEKPTYEDAFTDNEMMRCKEKPAIRSLLMAQNTWIQQ